MILSKERRKIRYQGLSLETALLNKVKVHVEDDWRYHGNVTAFIRASIIEKLEKEEHGDFREVKEEYEKLVKRQRELEKKYRGII